MPRPSKNSSQVGLILNPVNGYRDEIRRKGGKPKNHHKDYIRALKETQHQNRLDREAQSAPKKPLPQKFGDIQSKCFSQAALAGKNVTKKTFLKRQSSGPDMCEESKSPSPSAKGNRLSKPIVPRQNRIRDRQKQLSAFPDPMEWDGATAARWVKLLPDNFGWIAPLFEEINMTGERLLALSEAELAHKFRFSKSEAGIFHRHLKARQKRKPVNHIRKNLQKSEAVRQEPQSDNHLHNSYGKVPKYLQKMKEMKLEAAEVAKKAAEQAKIPRGMRLMTEDERLQTIARLEDNKLKIECAIRSLPLRCETLGLIQKSKDLNNQLDELETALKTFSRKKIFIDL